MTGRVFEQIPCIPDVTQPPTRVLLEAPADQSPHRRRHVAQIRLRLDDRRDCLGDIVTGKQPPAGEHLEQHDPERPDVHALIDGLTPRLLRRHVRRRPENDALARHRG
jgi:hypothetical protein